VPATSVNDSNFRAVGQVEHFKELLYSNGGWHTFDARSAAALRFRLGGPRPLPRLWIKHSWFSGCPILCPPRRTKDARCWHCRSAQVTARKVQYWDCPKNLYSRPVEFSFPSCYRHTCL